MLEGNAQKIGDRIRLSGRLINVTDGSSLWAGTFDEKFTDVFAVRDAISQKVADALPLRLNGEEQNRLKKRYTDNVEAYQLYITGRYHWRKLVPPDLRKAISFFQQAIDLDPNYALAYFGLADAYRGLAPAADVPAKDILRRLKWPPQKQSSSIRHWPNHATLAFIHAWFDWDWAGSQRSEASH